MIKVGTQSVPVLSVELGRCDGERVGSAAEITNEKLDVGITSRRHRERPEVVDADGNAGPFWQKQRGGGPSYRLPRHFPCLALQGVA